MVNTGRPSPACKSCRARRLKCDQTKPACNKCTRAKRACPGYREPFEVNFKDQTDLIIRKHENSNLVTKDTTHKKPRRGHRRSGSSSSESSVDSMSTIASETSEKSPTYNWYPALGGLLRFETPITDQASCYFVANYLCLKSHSDGCGLQFLWPLVRAAAQNDTFNSAFEAVSMASIASRPNSGALVPLARIYYDRALRQIAKTIQDREKSKEDQSLAAIIMLIIYEVLMWEDARNSLTFHIQGAQAMIKLRGPEQWNSKLGQTMFGFIRGFIIHQFAHSPRIAEEFEDMLWWAMEGPTDDEPKHELRRLNVETTILRKEVVDFMAKNPTESELPAALRIYRQAKLLNAELTRWFAVGPHLSMRRVQYWQEDVLEEDIHNSPAFPGKVYDFDNIFIGAKFLSLHLHRLILAEILLQTSTWIESCRACHPSACTQTQEAMALAKDEISEIIAIVPFYANAESPSPLGGMTCSFPLFVAGSSTVIDKKQKAFLIGRLSHISQSTGLKIAGRFAEELLRGTNDREWLENWEEQASSQYY